MDFLTAEQHISVSSIVIPVLTARVTVVTFPVTPVFRKVFDSESRISTPQRDFQENHLQDDHLRYCQEKKPEILSNIHNKSFHVDKERFSPKYQIGSMKVRSLPVLFTVSPVPRRAPKTSLKIRLL